MGMEGSKKFLEMFSVFIPIDRYIYIYIVNTVLTFYFKNESFIDFCTM